MTIDRAAVVEALAQKFPGLTPAVAARAEACERSLYAFVRAAWHVLEPHPLCDGWHIELMCNGLQAVSEGVIRRLLINIPPRHMKSSLVNVYWPAWMWIRKPWFRWLCTSYDSKLTTRDSVNCRTLIDSPWFQARWGRRFTWKRDQNAKTRYENSRGGVRISSSIKGLGLGEGGDGILIDDPHNTEKSLSSVDREMVIRWYTQTLGFRDNDPLTTIRVLIMQRLHEEDLTGFILANEPHLWTYICLPMEYEPDRPCKTQFGFDPRTEADELLWPDRYGRTEEERRAYVAERKRDLGPYGFAAQAQQRPTPQSGGIWLRSWFGRRFLQLPSSEVAGSGFSYTSWDLATKGLSTSNYCVGGKVTHFPKINAYYLQAVRRFRAEFAEQQQAVLDFAAAWPGAQAHVIEDKSNGPAIKSALQRALPGIVTWDPGSADKPTRWRAVSPRFQAGDVYLQDGAEWIEEFIAELCACPRAAQDDQADMVSQAILWREMPAKDKRGARTGKIMIGRPGGGYRGLPRPR